MKALFNIGNSVSLFFIFLLFLSVVVIFSFDENAASLYVSQNSMPKIEVSNFVAYDIGNENTSSKLSGKNAKQFDSFEEITDIELHRKNNDIVDILQAPTAIKKGDIIYFNNGVSDKRNGYSFYSKSAIYHINKKILEGREDFKIISDYENIIGENIHYDINSGVIKANNIKAILKPKNKQ